MIRYIMKFLWNSRRGFYSIFIEQMLISAVLTVCFLSMFDMVEKYTSPGMLDTDNVVLLTCMQRFHQNNGPDRFEVNNAIDAIIGNARQWEYVEAVSESSGLVPYMRPSEYYASEDSIYVTGGGKYFVHAKTADENADKVFVIYLQEGAWLHQQDDGTDPALISRQLAEDMKSEGNPVGLKFKYYGRTYTVTGVFDGAKEEPFVPAAPSIIRTWPFFDKVRPYREICFRIEPGHEQEFCSRLYKECKRLIPHFDTIDIGITDMEYFKSKAMSSEMSRLKLMLIPTALLVLFAFVGSLGLLMLNARKRAVEYSLHRAMGATRMTLMKLVIVQSLVLTLLASVPCIVIALAVFGFSLVSLYAILATVSLMLLFSLVSAGYPAWKIAQINPASVLHEE